MMRMAGLAGLILAVALAGRAEAQTKKDKGPETTTTLTFNAEIVKIESARGELKRVILTATNKNVGITNASHDVTRKTKVIFVDEKGNHDLTLRTVLTDEAAKEHFQTGKIIRVNVSPGAFINEIRFGPGLQNKPKTDDKP
jgi:hypothetical protein